MFPCPKCGAKTSMLGATGTRRRRECTSCHFRFNTVETLLVPPEKSPRTIDNMLSKEK